MTDATIASDAEVWAQISAEHAGRNRLTAEAMPANKAAIFDVLAIAGITSVVLTFDGCGDSGQIESVDAWIGDDRTELPEAIMEIVIPDRDGSGLERRMLKLSEAIEEIAYDLLRNHHPGWEINDGAYGEFRFELAGKTITLHHNQRYTEIDTSVHHW